MIASSPFSFASTVLATQNDQHNCFQIGSNQLECEQSKIINEKVLIRFFCANRQKGKPFSSIRISQRDCSNKAISGQAINVRNAKKFVDKIKNGSQFYGLAFNSGRTHIINIKTQRVLHYLKMCLNPAFARRRR